MSIFNSPTVSRTEDLFRENPYDQLFLPSPQKLSRFIFSYIFLMVIISAFLTGCSNDNDAAKTETSTSGYETLSLNYQGTPNAVTFPELAEDLGYLAPLKLNYIGSTVSGPQDIQSTVTGDTDFGTAFNGAIIKLKASHAPIKALIGSYGSDDDNPGSLYVAENSDIKAARDLIGKKIAVNALGAHAEFIIKEYLSRNGLTQDEINSVELITIPPLNMEQVLRNKQVDAVVFLGIGGNIIKDNALAKGGLRLLFTDVQLFGKFTAGSYVFREDFIAKNPNSVKKFVEGTAKAIEWARSTPREQVIARFKNIVAKRGRNEDESVLGYWKGTGIAQKGGVIADSEFQTWIDLLVRDGRLKAGDLHASDIYDNRFNPYYDTSKTPSKQ
jgi:ABC-type nitrate/sulfonate/bicarbonate transport system substrate-binding protein